MPYHTAANILSRYRKSGIPFPQHTLWKLYNKERIAAFLHSFFSDPEHTNATLEEARNEIWKNRSKLLHRHCSRPPSISWICKLLQKALFNAKPITLKIASINPLKRNIHETIEERFNFVMWIESLSKTDFSRLVWVDEHGFNFYTVKRRGWSIQGDPVVIHSYSAKGKNMTVLLAVSAVFGKVAMQALDSTTSIPVFTSFVGHILENWKSNPCIPEKLKQLGPIIVLDNLSSHQAVIDLAQHFFLPAYSPFLNVAEPVNRDHKLGIRKLFRYFHKMPQKLQSVQWGRKGKECVRFLQVIAHMAWNDLPNFYPRLHWEHIKKHYFPLCKDKTEIKN